MRIDVKTWITFAGTALLALVAGLTTTAAPINPTKPPTKAAPAFIPVVEANTKTGEVTYEVSTYQSVPVKRTRFVEKDGQKIAVEVVEYQTVISMQHRKLLLNSFNPMTADGKPLAQDDFARRVVPGAVLLVAWDGELPEAAYLKLFKGDTVILVAKTKPGTDALPPKTVPINDRK